MSFSFKKLYHSTFYVKLFHYYCKLVIIKQFFFIYILNLFYTDYFSLIIIEQNIMNIIIKLDLLDLSHYFHLLLLNWLFFNFSYQRFDLKRHWSNRMASLYTYSWLFYRFYVDLEGRPLWKLDWLELIWISCPFNDLFYSIC